jgi:predicted acyltransferase
VSECVAPAQVAESARRLMSVDALRGFDMFWIIGAGSIVKALNAMGETPFTNFLASQLTHVKWEGFHFYDLIFPLFLFIVGISIVFSVDKALMSHGHWSVLARIVRRSLLLFALGVFYYGGVSKPWPEVQLGGVLHRIAACYLLAAILYLYVRSTRGLLLVSVCLLVGYWAMVSWIPFPDLKLEKERVAQIAQEIGSDSPFAIAASVDSRIYGNLEEGRNLVNFIDFLYLPGKKAQTYYINEGLLSTLPAIVLSLFGALAALLLKNVGVEPMKKVVILALAGGLSILLGWLWSFEFHLIKRIWTSSFVLVAGGLSAWLLALFYWIIDIKGWRVWCQPFVWIGANALLIYMAVSIVNFQQLAERLVGGDIQSLLDTWGGKGFGGLVVAILGLLLAILLTRFLYKRNILLRI